MAWCACALLSLVPVLSFPVITILFFITPQQALQHDLPCAGAKMSQPSVRTTRLRAHLERAALRAQLRLRVTPDKDIEPLTITSEGECVHTTLGIALIECWLLGALPQK